MIPQNSLLDQCPECEGTLNKNSSQTFCRECGLVVSRVFTDSAYVFNDQNLNGTLSRQYVAIGNRTDFVGGLGTCIDYEHSKHLRDKNGKILDPKAQKLFRRLKKHYVKFLRIKDHETEYRILNILKKVCLNLKINTDIQKGSAHLYKKILREYTKSKIVNNISLIAACIYVNVKGYNTPKSIQEIAEAFNKYGHRVTPRLILRDTMKYTKVIKPFQIKLSRNITPTSQSKAYLTKMVNQVINELSDERIRMKAKSYAKEQFKIDLMKVSRKMLTYFDKHKELKGGKNPQIFTASTIYCADLVISKILGHKKIFTQRMVSEATKIPEYSIRDHYVNCIREHINTFIPNKKGIIADFF